MKPRSLLPISLAVTLFIAFNASGAVDQKGDGTVLEAKDFHRPAPMATGDYSPAASNKNNIVKPASIGHFPEAGTQCRLLSLPLHFEKNEGQTDATVKYLSRGKGYALFLRADEAVLRLNSPPARGPVMSDRSQTHSNLQTPPASVLRLRLIGANPEPGTTGLAPFAGKVNYFKGSDPAQWRTNVPTYGQVKYQHIYPGIDLVFYGSSQQQLEYDFIVAPGADPSQIALDFEGADKIEVEANGGLVLHTASGQIRQHKPRIYQMVKGDRREVEGGYVLAGDCDQERIRSAFRNESAFNSQSSTLNSVRLFVGTHDPTIPLIIDPVLSYSTFLGGGNTDYAQGIALDSAGNAYVVGFTHSINFPVTNGISSTLAGNPAFDRDVFVAKLKPDGSGLVYATYLGGGSGDTGLSIAVDQSGNAYIAGGTGTGNAPDFPSVNAFQPAPAGSADAFVSKLGPDGGALVYSTFLGGSDADTAYGIAVDSAGNAYVGGATSSTNFPTVNPLQAGYGGKSSQDGPGDGFVAKFDPTGSALVFSTYLGGNQDDSALGIAVDGTGSAFVTGWTSSADFPTTNAMQPNFGGGPTDAFVAKLTPTGTSFVFSTFLGGEGIDTDANGRTGIAVDTTGNAYITGYTTSTNFPVINALQPTKRGFADTFVAKLKGDGSSFFYSTYFNGSGVARPNAIAVDSAGNAYVAGSTYSGDLPVVNAVQPTYAGGDDAFVLKLDPDGVAVSYSTFLGGGAGDTAYGIALDASGNAYVCGVTYSTNFPVVKALQPAFAGGDSDAFIVKLAADQDLSPPRLVVASAHDDPTVVEIEFSEPVGEATATDALNYQISAGIAVLSASKGVNSKTVLLKTSAIPFDLTPTLTVNNVKDRALPNAITIAPDSQIVIIRTQGRIARREFWDIPGGAVDSLRASPKFPHLPDFLDYATSFESPANQRDNYGVQFAGYITAPVTGDYVFYLNADDRAVLYLGTDDTPESKRAIASEPAANNPREWIGGLNQLARGDPPANISRPIRLDAGRRYYIEALMKEANGGDNLAVAWRKPGDPELKNGAPPIPGKYLSASKQFGPPVVRQAPVSQTVEESEPVALWVSVEGSPPFDFQWLKIDVAISGETNSVLRIAAASPNDNGNRYAVRVSNAQGVVTSAEAILTVNPDLVAPRVLSAEGSVGLNRITLKFSEPIDASEAVNTANFSLSGGLTVNSARLLPDRVTVVLATTPQQSGQSYVLGISGIHDLSSARNLVPPDSRISFIAYVPEEFVGPFPSWANLKRDYGGVGDGIADDTAALQKALDEVGTSGHPHVLWIPAGTYRITRGLVFKYKASVSIMGEHPDNTVILWDGPNDGIMLHSNGVTYHSLGRLTFDGRGRALSAIDHKWDGTNQPYSTSGSEYSDLVVKDVAYGIRAGVAINDAEVAVLRCRFLRCSQAGISMESYNALDWWAWHCVFERCRVGVTNRRYAGHCHVYQSLFRNSAEADITMGNCSGWFSFRGNTSVGSKAFFAVPFIFCGGEITIQGNTIIDPLDTVVIGVADLGPVLLFDNIIRSRAEVQQGPVVSVADNLVSIGNTFTVAFPVQAGGRVITIDDRVVSRDSLDLEEPELPGPLASRNRPIIEVPAGTGGTAIQSAIDQASQLRGSRPVVHLPVGDYFIDRTLVIPAGADLQLVGDGYYFSSMLRWNAAGAGPVLRLEGPSRATLREFSIFAAPSVKGIIIDNCDQVGARVFMEQANLVGSKRHNLLVDRLDRTDVSMRDSTHNDCSDASFKVIGGPLTAANNPAKGRVSLIGGVTGGNELSYDVIKGGRLVVEDVWYEGSPPRFLRLTDSGRFSLSGAMIYTADPNHGGVVSEIPPVEIANFRGDIALLTTTFASVGSKVLIHDDASDLNLLLMGVNGQNQNYIVNNSASARVSVVASLGDLFTDHGTSIPDVGSTEPAFLKRMLAPIRAETLPSLHALPEGVTDARLYRVTVNNALVGIQLSPTNAPPVLTSIQDQIVNEGSTLTLTNQVTDPDLPYQTLTFSLALGAPAGTSINSTNGVFTWTPTETQGPSTNLIGVVVADDGSPESSATNTVTVIVNEVNSAPQLAPIADRTIKEGDPWRPAQYGLLREVYTNIPGGAVSDLTNAPAFPANPSSSDLLTISFEAPSNVADNYGQRVRGYLVPPASGDYTFWIASDDTSILYLSTDEDPAHKVRIASVNSWTNPRQWNKEINQQSAGIALTSGSRYYIEALQKDGGSGDNLAVRWQLPDGTIEEPIPASHFIVWDPDILIATASATDSDLPTNALTFELISPLSGMAINTNTGAISWTPTEAQGPGMYPITVRVSDNGVPPSSATRTFTVTVNEVNTAPVLTLPPNTNINELVPFTAKATAIDADIPTNALVFALVSGPVGLTVSSAGVINWSPDESQGPSANTVTISITDTNPLAVNATSLSVTSSFQIVVSEVNVAPVLAAMTNRTVNPGQTISFTATATDADVPANALSFSLLSPPAGAGITSGGLFNWRPGVALASTTNVLEVMVQDNGAPVSNDTRSFSVIVNPLAAPVVLTPLGYANGQFTLGVTGPLGPDYVIMASTNLAQWSDLVTNPSPTLPFQHTDTEAGSFSNRAYRVRLTP